MTTLQSAPRVLALAATLAFSITCVNPEAAALPKDSTGAVLAPVSDIAVALGATTIGRGATTRATAVLHDAAQNVLSGRDVTWSSNNIAIATVDATSGDIAAIAEGVADIIATAEGVTGRAALTVHTPVASVAASLGLSSLFVGGTTTAVATAMDATGQPLPRTMTFNSANSLIATVNSSSGLVTAVSPGTTIIRATTEGVTGTASVAVNTMPVASVSVTVTPSSITTGSTTTARAVMRDANGDPLTGRLVTWTSDNTAVATVNGSTGTVTAVGAGTANIIGTSEGITGQAPVSVTNPPVASVSVTLGSATLRTGQSTNAFAVTRDASNTILNGRVVTWSSDNTGVATVNPSTGAVNAVTPGTANIIATSEGVTGQAALTVTVWPVASVSVSMSSPSITVGNTSTATVVLRDANNVVLTGRVVSFTSSNTGTATVNPSTGVATGVGNGTTNIRATSEGVVGQASLTVTAPVASVAVTLTPTLSVGQSTTATAVLRDAANNILTGRVVSWSSDNTAVATVNSSTGAVNAVALGTANISALSEGVTGSSQLTVVAAAPPGTLVFASDWHTATGNSDAALRDASQKVPWDSQANTSNSILSVVPSTGLGFPSANCLRVAHLTGGGGTAWIGIGGAWGLPPIGGTLYYRFYLRNDVSDSEGNQSGANLHPIETNAPAGSGYVDGGWELKFGWNNNGTWPLMLAIDGINTPQYMWTMFTTAGGTTRATLNKNTTYRFEFAFTRTAANTWSVAARTYLGDSTTPLFNETTWKTADTGAPMSTGGLNMSMSNSDAQMTKLRFGINGGPFVNAVQYHYFGAVAVSTAGWIGPYVQGESP